MERYIDNILQFAEKEWKKKYPENLNGIVSAYRQADQMLEKIEEGLKNCGPDSLRVDLGHNKTDAWIILSPRISGISYDLYEYWGPKGWGLLEGKQILNW